MNRLKIFLLLGMTAIAGLLTAGEKELKVLFIGNSYTYYHELPAVMARLGADAGWTVEAKHHTGGGYSLLRHVEEKKVFGVIAEKDWDFVVLQDHSMRPQKYPGKLYAAARILDEKIRAQGARTVFYMTWAREYDPGMIRALTDVYGRAARELDAVLVPVGKAWADAVKRTEVDLYTDDGSHPNQHGTYLTALMFLGRLTGSLPQALSNGGLAEVSREDTEILRNIARRCLE